MQCLIRPDTSDIKALEEVVKKRVYDRLPLFSPPLKKKKEKKSLGKRRTLPAGMVWCDCGANIGAFALWAVLEHKAEMCMPSSPSLKTVD